MYHEESKTRIRQLQRVGWQVEIHWKPNNTTENHQFNPEGPRILERKNSDETDNYLVVYWWHGH